MSEDTIPFPVLTQEAERAAVFDWWARLTGCETNYAGKRLQRSMPAATGAILRRARSPEDALLTDGFRELWFALPDRLRVTRQMPAWGCVAAVLADVHEHQPDIEFAAAMAAEIEPGAGKPRVSELRFSQLQHSADLVELHRRMRRMVHLLRGRVNVLSLADSILHWHRELLFGPDVAPHRRLPVRWANAYFTALARYQHNA